MYVNLRVLKVNDTSQAETEMWTKALRLHGGLKLPGTPERGVQGGGGQAPLLPFLKGARGGNSALSM